MDKCESCVWYSYDEEYDDFVCEMDLDEDEMARFLSLRPGTAPTGVPATTIAPPADNKQNAPPVRVDLS